MVMTSSYSDSVFLYLVNSRHTHTSIIIMREIITTIIIIGNIRKYVLGSGVPTYIGVETWMYLLKTTIQ